VHLPWEPPWPELNQLCESKPFGLFCRSSLPNEHQRLICKACGLPTSGTGCGGAGCSSTSVCGMHDHLEVRIPPEQVQEQLGRPAWEAPYVWETNYMEDL